MGLLFENQIFDYLNSLKNYMRIQPLNLGGASGGDGGWGGPPGGFIGYLPQSRVAYDETEAATLATTVSGTLVDNLNHIRYRIGVLETTSGGGGSPLSVYDEGVLVASGVTIIDFAGSNVLATAITPTQVLVTITGGGGAGDHVHIYGEDLTSQVSGGDVFITSNTFKSDTLRAYLNGIRQRDAYVTERPGLDGFILSFTPVTNDELFVDYDIPTGTVVTGWGDIAWGDDGWGT
jgi:hypothetical protein